MYKDIISYRLADGVSQEHLLKVAKQVVDEWMSKQSGFIKWEVNTNSNGSYTDIVSWKNKESAKLAEQQMLNIPQAAAWFSCYQMDSIKSENLTQIADF